MLSNAVVTAIIVYHSDRALARTPNAKYLGAGRLSENHPNSTFRYVYPLLNTRAGGEPAVRRGGGNMVPEQRALRDYLELGNSLSIRLILSGGA
jgi:hypothetical protein